MKNWKRIMILALVAVFAGSVVIFASGENSVVSWSYLTGTFWEQLEQILRVKTEDMEGVYTAAGEKLVEKLSQSEETAGWTANDSFEIIYPLAGETVTLSAGSGCVWYSGTGAASAVLVDVTSGEELEAGKSLVAGHRYLAEQETVITALSESSCSVEGMWKTTATGEAPPVPFELTFDDVTEDDWFYSAVVYVVQQELFNGTSETTFEPMTYMNRAMLVTVLHRVAEKPAVEGESVFEDVASTDWFYPGVCWASHIGVVNGVSATQFHPLGNVTREQIAVILYRYAAYLGYDVTARTSLDGFADHDKVSTYALDGVSWAAAEGLMKGSNGLLNPTSGATRAEVATMMQRYAAWLTEK